MKPRKLFDNSKDRRIQKTLRLLHEALASLMRDSPYEEISVQEILDRANVGRSTFYMHFTGKDDLLVSSIHELLGAADGPNELPAGFSLPIFEHILQHRRTAHTVLGPGAWSVVHDRLRRVLADRVAKDLKLRTRNGIPPDLLAQHVAGTFILVLNWWVENQPRLQPKEVDALFRSLVGPVLPPGGPPPVRNRPASSPATAD